MAGRSFRLGDWLVEPRLNRLTRDGQSIRIELKLMDVLVCLSEHAGELVERQELIDAVWATEFNSENVLTRAIAALRKILCDDPKQPRYIETIHRRGYRLAMAVDGTPDEPVQAETEHGCCRLVHEKRLYSLRKGESLIGRAPDVDISVDALRASRHHARITVVGNLAVLEDLKSKNGTFVQGRRIEEPTPLHDRDEIAIGDAVLVFRVEQGPKPTVTDIDQ